MNSNRFTNLVRLAFVFCLAVAVSNVVAAPRPDLDLSGKWSIRLDRNQVGEDEQWFAATMSDQTIDLPGSLQAQGYGNEVTVDTEWTGGINDQSWFKSPKYEKYRQPGNIKVPFWLQPEKHYVGAAWFQRSLNVPDDWQGKRILLHLERCHWETAIWVDDTRIGSDNSLSTPHVFDLTGRLTPGAHRLTVRVDNRVKIGVGINAHSVTDHTQSNWNGVIGGIQLRATDCAWIDDVQVYPDLERNAAKVRITIGNRTGSGGRGNVSVSARSCNSSTAHDVAEKEKTFALDADQSTTIELDYPMGAEVPLWDEFNPALYRLEVVLNAETDTQRHAGRKTVTFGMREITTQGTQLAINGRPIFLRGTLECCIFPLTGYPPMDVESWKRIIRVCKAHGLNHMRFHSWCPPKAAFLAADEIGFYYQVECGLWANQGSTVGDGRPVDRFLYEEQERILREYGNHPSFIMLAYGNEPAGRNQRRFLGDLVNMWKKKDPRHVYTSAAGWPIIPENQFHNAPAPRIQAWGAGLRSRINARPPETVTDYRDYVSQHDVPVVSHEIGQWCVYPNLDEINKYTGVLKATNFEVFRDLLTDNHMADQARDFLMASGKLQTLCYKEEIESALRTPGFGGFQLLDLHDFPGQGTALVGVLDPFWDSKSYVTPGEFRRFCDQTVPLVRMAKRAWTENETFEATVEVAHYGADDTDGAVVTWRLETEDGQVVASGVLPPKRLKNGNVCDIGDIRVSLGPIAGPAQLRLVVGIENTAYENDWDLWVYTESVNTDAPADVLIARELDDAACHRLEDGGKVLLLIESTRVETGATLGFSSVFWNTAWTGGQAPHTLGILCDPKHAALADFPTEYHSNWQWWYLVSQAAAMQLDDLPGDLRPVVQVIDTWFEARRLGLVFEAKVHGGRLLVCSIDLAKNLADNPVASQMRQSLLGYMSSDKFDPQVEVSAQAIRGLMRALSEMQRLGATATTDSQQPGYPTAHALDGDATTIWHTGWGEKEKPFPHHLIIDLQKPMTVAGMACLPRQDMQNGRIAKFSIYLSNAGTGWGESVAAGTWPNTKELKQVPFETPQQARYVKLVAESEVNGGVWASAAEVSVMTE